MTDDRLKSGTESGAPVFPVVGIGASAGGLEALRGLFKAMPADTGAGFVLVQHLDPTHDSLMAELLTKYARIPVVQVNDGMQVAPNRLHVIPPNTVMTIARGVLHLSEPTEPRGLRMPIDRFFSSLAEDQQERAIALVLSGAGSDGTYGVRLVKARGGMVLAQDPSLAGYDGMPRSAVATGDVDYVLPVEEIPAVLVRYIEHFHSHGGPLLDNARADKDFLDNILALLVARQDYDFHCYRRGTIHRRILRRMGLNHVSSLEEYHRQLRNDDNEVHALGKDLLIGVTGFFREPEAWRLLRDKVLPELFARLDKDEVIRTWVPGCATGEEAYTLAMVLTEASRAAGRSNGLIVFATDVDREALEVARTGIYAESLVADMEPERLRRFFSREGDDFQVKKGLREKVIFAPQNLISDPPFSALSLISCRNLLIYIEPEFQDRLMGLFHFALRDGGCLFLGSSETVGHDSGLFLPVSRQWRIYRRIDGAPPTNLEFPSSPGPSRGRPLRGDGQSRPRGNGYGPLAHKALIERFAPASVLVDRGYRVLYYHGPVRDYLGPAPGEPSDDLLALTGEGLRPKLRTVLRQAAAEGRPVEVGGAHVRRGEQWYTVSVSAAPLHEAEGAEGMLLVSFRDQRKSQPEEQGEFARSSGEESLTAQLETELKATREELCNTVEQMETSNEELKASNEEVMSMNEELQSTNEELETSKEELQSLNEELTTLNSQLEEKVHELEEANNDLGNLLVSTDIATLFLDRRLRIHRYTPAIGRLIHLIPSDLGRGVTDITWRFEDPHLLDDARAVLGGRDLEPREIRGRDDSWYQRRVLPYCTEDAAIEGVVITFTDITRRKRMEEELHERTRSLEDADRRKNEFLAMLGHELRNPLTPIRNAVQLMTFAGEGPIDLGWAAEIIDRQTRHLERMVDDLLDMARIRKGLLAIERKPQRLQRLLLDTLAATKPALEAKGHRLSVDLGEAPLTVMGDPTRLIQVFSNLLNNAVRYTPNGGEIRVSLRQSSADCARVVVEDNGNGISAGLLPHVFDIFNDARVHPERSNAGLGLGLGLVKQIVLLHGGEVGVASDGPGRGSCFSVRLPLAAEGEAVPDDEPDHRNALTRPARSLNILLVDDNPDVRDSLERLLTALGHRVKTLDAGNKVVSGVRESPPDLLLLDLGLPDIDGYQVARALADLPQRREFKLVAVTGYATDRGMSEKGEEDFDGYLVKPITVAMLDPFM